MSGLRIYNSDPASPLSRCQSESAWEDRCVRYAEHVSKPGDERDHEDERGYSWGSATKVRALPEPTMHILYTTAQDDALRELLSYCREREVYKGRDNEIGADTAYGDVADRLAKILDGEA